MLTVDGSAGEGGGQVLRSSLALSLVTRTAFRIEHVRARRSRRGLLHQHLTAVQAARALSGAETAGASLGSRELTFRPGPVQSGDYEFSIGTAGSTSLVLETILPALALAAGPSTVVLEGGTHNPASPTFEFLERTFLPLIERMGPGIEITLERPGYAPAGGGRLRVAITPAKGLARVDVLERGALRARRAVATVMNLPAHIGEREIATLTHALGWDPGAGHVEVRHDARGPGNVLRAEIESDALCEVFSAFGERGVPAEKVATRLSREVRAYLESTAPVGPHLADQLVLWMAIAGAGAFRTLPLTGHTRSQLEVLHAFLGSTPRVSQETREVVRVEV